MRIARAMRVSNRRTKMRAMERLREYQQAKEQILAEKEARRAELERKRHEHIRIKPMTEADRTKSPTLMCERCGPSVHSYYGKANGMVMYSCACGVLRQWGAE